MKSTTPYERKQCRLLDLKVDEETGAFEGLASVYGNTDLGGDVVEKGAFTKSIQDRGSEVPILWQHDSALSIGLGEVTDSNKGLMLKGQLELDLPEAKSAYIRLKKGLVKGLSIGYKSIPDKTVIEKGIRRLKEVKLYEVSLVTFPMNEQALVTAVKAEGVEEDENEFYAALDATKEQTTTMVEAKEGRTISKATRQRIEEAITSLQALLALAEAASDGTLDGKGAATQHSSEPDQRHSLLTSLDSKFKEIKL